MAVVLANPKVVERVHPVRPPMATIGRQRKVGLLGSHHSLEYAPWFDPSWELWGHASSRFYYKREPERYFDLHRKECWVMAHKHDRYMSWLKRNIVPIYMQDVDKEVPASIRYPREIIFAENRRYFTCHAAYMIALALSEGVTHIGVWGINYSADSEYGTQRGSCEYWLGVAEGRGVRIVLSEKNTLLQHPAQLYGYESHDENGRLVEAYRSKKTTLDTQSGPLQLTLLKPGELVPFPAAPPSSVAQRELNIDRDRKPIEWEEGLIGAPHGEWYRNTDGKSRHFADERTVKSIHEQTAGVSVVPRLHVEVPEAERNESISLVGHPSGRDVDGPKAVESRLSGMACLSKQAGRHVAGAGKHSNKHSGARHRKSMGKTRTVRRHD